MSSSTNTSWGEAFAVTTLLTGGLLGALAFLMLSSPGASSPATRAPTPSPAGALTLGMSWPGLELDAAQLEQARKAYQKDSSALLQAPPAQRLIEAVRQINDHQFTTYPVPLIPEEQLNNELEYALSEAITPIDVRTQFVALGEPLFEACEQGLSAIQQDLAAGKLTMEQATTDPDFETYSVYRRHCGNMLAELSRRGLVDAKGQWASPQKQLLARLLQHYRWANMAKFHAPALEQLSPRERDVFMRWRVEDARAFPAEQRRKHLASLLRHDPGYPEGMALALLAYDEGDKRGAAEILSRYHNQSPQDPTYAAMYKAITRELAGKNP